jgi:hypothetical protein
VANRKVHAPVSAEFLEGFLPSDVTGVSLLMLLESPAEGKQRGIKVKAPAGKLSHIVVSVLPQLYCDAFSCEAGCC